MNWDPISRATNQTYQITGSEVGKDIRVTVGYSDDKGFAESVILSTVSVAGTNTTDLTTTGTSTLTTVDINAGDIDGTVIGADTASTGAFTTLAASGTTTSSGDLTATGTSTLTTVDIDGGEIDGTAIRSTTAASGAFTTLSASGNTTLSSDLEVTGNTTFASTLDVNGGITFNGGGIINNVQIGVTGDNVIDTSEGNLTINSSSSTTTIDDDVVVSGELIVEGNTVIHSQGINVDGSPLITKKNDGAIHLGENSLISKEEDGRQKLYAQDANGSAIPIDITNGSKLLINGRDVEQSINNVGALSAALTGLPTSS